MTMGAIRRLVADKEHVFFLTRDVGHHAVEPCPLLHVPNDLRVRLVALELGATTRPELREIKLEVTSFVPEVREQLTVQDKRTYFRPTTSDVKYAIGHFFAGQFACQVAGREPYPRTREITTPVLIGIAAARLRTNDILASIPLHLAFIGGLHAFGMPEHLEELPTPHRRRSSVTDMESHLLVDLQIP